MNGMKEWYVRMSNGNVYGPADVASLVSWAEDGRIDPSSSLSKDRIKWTPAQLMDELGMKWLVELEPGKPIGPYNRKFLISSHAEGSLPDRAVSSNTSASSVKRSCLSNPSICDSNETYPPVLAPFLRYTVQLNVRSPTELTSVLCRVRCAL